MGASTVLITVPRLNLPGGVANYYRVLKPYLGDTEFFEVGKTGGNVLVRLLSDWWRFHRRLNGVSLVHLNPSLGSKATFRDAVFLLIARAHGIPVLLLFHGWDASILRRFRRTIRWVSNKSKMIVVLAEDFRQQLRDAGVTVPIYLTTTCVEDSAFDHEREYTDDLRVLFLSRLDHGKGLSIALQATDNLTVAGDGPRRDQIPSGVRYLGHVEGDEKTRAYLDANVYLFPTMYGEGMPTTVLEAMAHGLPVVTRSVGGLKDFFDERNGCITDSIDPAEFRRLLESLTPAKRREIGEYNRRYAKSHFAASEVAARLVRMYDLILRGEHADNATSRSYG